MFWTHFPRRNTPLKTGSGNCRPRMSRLPANWLPFLRPLRAARFKVRGGHSLKSSRYQRTASISTANHLICICCICGSSSFAPFWCNFFRPGSRSFHVGDQLKCEEGQSGFPAASPLGLLCEPGLLLRVDDFEVEREPSIGLGGHRNHLLIRMAVRTFHVDFHEERQHRLPRPLEGGQVVVLIRPHLGS